MPEEVITEVNTSEPTVRMKDFVEFLLNNMSESEQNEAIKIIVESVRDDRMFKLTRLADQVNSITISTNKLEDILKANC